MKARAARMKALVQSHQHHVWFEARLTSALAIGLGMSSPVENGFLFDYALGEPYLPGSGLKGLMRAWVEEWDSEEISLVNLLLGDDSPRKTKTGAADAAGALIVFDARPLAPCELQRDTITAHQVDYHKEGAQIWPGDWQSPIPIPHLSIKAGVCFGFGLALRPGQGATEENLNSAATWLDMGLQHLGAGARTARGYGRIQRISA